MYPAASLDQKHIFMKTLNSMLKQTMAPKLNEIW